MSDSKLEIINPPNNLGNKVVKGGPGAVDLATLERAEAVIADMAGDYLEWIQEDLQKMEKAFAALSSASGDRQAEIDEVYQISHDIKGQGGSFGYDLMTAIGNQLCRLIEKSNSIGDDEIAAIGLHVNAMKLIITQRMEGDGGEAGDNMLVGLQQVVDKLVA